MNKNEPIRALLPSLLVLGAVFYFINSACMKSGSDDTDHAPYPGQNPPCRRQPPPAGAEVAFLEPADGAEFSSADARGLIEVPVRLEAKGVTVVSTPVCRKGFGRFIIRVRRESEPCPAREIQVTDQAATLLLGPGRWTLEAIFVDGAAQPYEPELSDTIHVTLIGTGAQAGGSPCEP